MMRLVIVLALILLAGLIDPSTAPTPPEPRGVRVDRHIDAHVPAREGEPSGSAPTTRSERNSAPDPVPGTDVMQSPSSPPAIQSPRDPLSRDRRY